MTAPAPAITSPQNPLVAANIPAKRRKSGVAYAEGERVVVEALRGEWTCDILFIAQQFSQTPEGSELLALAEARQCKAFLASTSVLAKLSGCDTPPPVGVLVRPPAAMQDLPARVLVLDRLADPGNVGTLIRTAAAFGFSVILTEGSVRLTNEKMIRSTAGLCFRQGGVREEGAAAALAGKLTSHRIFVLDPGAQRTFADIQFSEQPIALVLGNEAQGIEDSVWGRFEAVRIPMCEGVESLNVAVSGAIALYEISRMASR